MMSQWKINGIIKDYPQGTRVELESMAGELQMPLGLQGLWKLWTISGKSM